MNAVKTTAAAAINHCRHVPLSVSPNLMCLCLPEVILLAEYYHFLTRLLANQETLQANQEAIFSLLEELTRDAATTRRLWLRLARRYGWLDDEQNGAQPDPPA